MRFGTLWDHSWGKGLILHQGTLDIKSTHEMGEKSPKKTLGKAYKEFIEGA